VNFRIIFQFKAYGSVYDKSFLPTQQVLEAVLLLCWQRHANWGRWVWFHGAHINVILWLSIRPRKLDVRQIRIHAV